MKMQKSVIYFFFKFENEYLKDKIIAKLEIIVNIHGNREVLCIAYVFKIQCTENLPAVFYNGSNYDYHFIIKELAEEFKKQFPCLKESTVKILTFTVPIEKKSQKFIKNEKKIQTINLTYYNFLKVKDLLQAHYQILSLIFLKEFIELNVNTDVIKKKNVKLVELNTSIATLFLNLQTLKII